MTPVQKILKMVKELEEEVGLRLGGRTTCQDPRTKACIDCAFGEINNILEKLDPCGSDSSPTSPLNSHS